ncbi:MAG: SMC-Scp complex subunit ScpB [Myxococcota bacterium]
MQDENVTASDLVGAIEAVLFAAGEPMTVREIRQVFVRLWQDVPDEQRTVLEGDLATAVETLRERWRNGEDRGFVLAEVSGGFGFRSNPRHAQIVKHLHESRPVRLSRAALETLAIVAYRQPATRPDIEHIRGVDCSATLRLLLDRNLVRIVGKKEEPGRPLLYGTTKEFLSFFNLPSLAQLPSLREFHELTSESQEELETFEGGVRPSLEELSGSARKLNLAEEPALDQLDEAVANLTTTEATTRDVLAAEGLALDATDDSTSAPEPDPEGASDAQ